MRNLIILIFFLLLFISSCSIFDKNYQYGSYDMEKTTTNETMPTIYGRIFDYTTKEPVKLGAIQKNDKLFLRADTFGRYQFHIEKGHYKFTGVAYPYLSVTISKIKVKEGDSIRIDYYLKINDRGFDADESVERQLFHNEPKWRWRKFKKETTSFKNSHR